jgi:hypothetical protein
VAQVTLNGPRVLPVIGKLVAAGMTQHVAMNQEREFGSLSHPVNHPLIACNAKRGAALAHEDVQRLDRSLPLQPPRSARISLLPIGWTAVSPPLERRTWRRPVVRDRPSAMPLAHWRAGRGGTPTG